MDFCCTPCKSKPYAVFQAFSFLAFCLLTSFSAYAANANSFKTPEYYNSGGLDAIHAADAYALGYTGAGITLGIVDGAVRADHPELAGKVTSEIIGVDVSTGLPYVPDWEEDIHGSHVAGIMAARRDGVGMHGVAFDADLVSAIYYGDEGGNERELISLDVLGFFAARPQVRVINNSWVENDNPILRGTTPADVKKELEKYSTLKELVTLSTDHNKVIVFAGGNDNWSSPRLPGALPRFFPELKAWINVVALDMEASRIDSSGALQLGSFSTGMLSNLAQYAQLWTVSAPGMGINSLNAGDKGYIEESGTSMAAPFVSGTLGLVQQAFPWMTGKQLADAVLTTADNTFKAPPHLFQSTWDEDGNYYDSVTIIEIDGDGSFAPAEARRLIESLGDLLGQIFLDLFDSGHYSLFELTKEEVFGRGILDAGKAVRGIALLDANRMSAADVVTLTELSNVKHALETFDTQGYFGEFSNDIAQRQWDDKYHHPDFLTGEDATALRDSSAAAPLAIGLRKIGQGMLVLSGSNSYQGATVVEGGALAVSKRADGSGGELLQSDVLVRTGGLLLGDGEIKKSVINAGVVAPGYRGLSLMVHEYAQTAEGSLHMGVTGDGRHAVLKADSATLAGKLRFVPAPGFYADRYSIQVSSVQSSTLSGAFSNVDMLSLSPTLNFDLHSNDGLGTAVINQQRAANAYSRYADNHTSFTVGQALSRVTGNAAGDMQNLLAALDWSNPSGRDIAPSMEQLGPGAYDAVARASLDAQRQLNALLARRLLGANMAPASDGNAEGLQGWGLPFGEYAHRSSSGGAAGFTSLGGGIALGVDRLWNNGLTTGLDVTFTDRRTDIHYAGSAKADILAASAGGHALFRPRAWDGAYFLGLARVGVEDVSLNRRVDFNGYARQHSARWTGFTSDALLEGGKDWSCDTSTVWGAVKIGPLARLEYSLNSRSALTEKGAGASALKVDASVNHTLSSVLGAHVGAAQDLASGATFSWDIMAGWRHDWLDGSFSTSAAFRDYGAGFASRSDMRGRDGMSVLGGVRLTSVDGFFGQVEVGAEVFRSQASSCSGGISFGIEF